MYLPRELRNKIYSFLLVDEEPINLLTLHGHSRWFCKEPRFCLYLHVLGVCRQMSYEAEEVIYGQNTFFVNVHPLWECARPLSWWSHAELQPKVDLTCLACSSQDKGEGFNEVDMHLWNVDIQRIQRLHICLRPYTYLQWRYTKTTRFIPATRCRHTFKSLPDNLRLSLLIVTVSTRSIMSPLEVNDWVHWDHMVWRYLDTPDADDWKRHVEKDLAREVYSILTYAKRCARNIAFACSSQQEIEDPNLEPIARKVPQGFLTGNLEYVACSGHTAQAESERPPELVGGNRDAIITRCQERGEQLIDDTQLQILRWVL